MVGISVIDRDLLDHDTVGSCQLTLAELVAEIGPREIRFFGRSGELRAGGVLLLLVSVEEGGG